MHVMMLSFIYDILPSRVVFGVGCLDKLPEEIERLGAHRALVLSTPEQRKEGQQIVDRLGARAVGLFDQAVMHVPIEIAEQAREQAQGTGRGLLRRGRRRVDHGLGESHRAGIDASDSCRSRPPTRARR